jgi:small subunit ribosomal protein S8
MLNDPIADMLTRIRNANRVERAAVDMPATRLKERVAKVLKDEGFVLDYQIGAFTSGPDGHDVFETGSDAARKKPILRIFLKYGPEGEKVIRHIERASRPGRRLYRNHSQLPPVLDGMGVAILSTSRGVMSDRQARVQRVGGELLCTVW